jgi:hypothetical protein
MRGHARENRRPPSPLAAALRRGDNRALGSRMDLRPLARHDQQSLWTILTKAFSVSEHVLSDEILLLLHFPLHPAACHKKTRPVAVFSHGPRI